MTSNKLVEEGGTTNSLLPVQLALNTKTASELVTRRVGAGGAVLRRFGSCPKAVCIVPRKKAESRKEHRLRRQQVDPTRLGFC